MNRIIARPKQLSAAVDRIARITREIEFNMVAAFAAVSRVALAAAYMGNPPTWRPLLRSTGPTIGRKRRARRARERRIEARR